MNFQEAEKKYNDLRTQHNAGKLSDADFESEVGKLKLQDDQGRWWMIGVQSGEWYMHDGQKWAKGKPPIPTAAPAPSATTSPAPDVSRKPVEKPKPIVEDKSKVAAEDKSKGGSALPARLFSAKPAGREGGRPLSRNVIIGIVAAVVVLVLVCIGVGYFVVWPMVSGTNTTNVVRTPTVFVAKASPTTGSVVIPTIAPVATNTPFIAPTVPLPPTPAVTTAASSSAASSSASASSKVAGPTATKKPAGTLTPTKPAQSPTPAAPPGVYISKISTDPAAPNFNEPMGFRVTFFNNTGGIQHYTWKVKIFKCQTSCTPEELAINKSIGESIVMDTNFAVGSEEQVIRKQWSVGVGVCTLVLNVYYLDGNSNLVPFTTTDGKQIYQQVNMCR